MAGSHRTITYEKCFVAFLDILGFKENVIKSQDSSVKLGILIQSLSICGGFSSGVKKTTGYGDLSIQSRFFSDTIVFFTKANPKYLTQLFFVIRYLQDRLWEKGICLRGSITIGDMYWPDKEKDITVGPGLIEAYELESEVAIYPRIVVSNRLFSYIKRREIDSYPFGQTGDLKNLIQQDEDGVFFLDLLGKKITRIKTETFQKSKDGFFSILWINELGSKHQEILEKVKEIVQKNSRSKDIKKQQKYNWLNSYLSKTETEE